MWVRGLKLTTTEGGVECPLSHPMWVRGLKLTTTEGGVECPLGRILCGCVD